MGIYDNHLDFGGNKLQIAGLAIGAIIIVAIILYALSSTPIQTQVNPLGITFQKNPIKSGETSQVTVKITNSSGKDLPDVAVALFAKETSEFDIYSLNSKFEGSRVTIPILSNGTSREITFVLNPIGTILPGTYVIVAGTNLDGNEYKKEAVLTVQ